MNVEISAGAVEPIVHIHDPDGVLTTGSTLRWWARLSRPGSGLDGYVLNSSNAFVTEASAGADKYRTLPEQSGLAGIYASSLNTSLISNTLAGDIYVITVEETSPTARILDSGEIRTRLVPAVQSGLATAAGVTTAAGAVTVAPGGIGVTSIADNAITAGSISAAAVTKIQAGLAALVAAATWATTDGTMTKGAALDLLRRRVTNKRVLSIIGVLSFFADDGTTVEKTSTVRDVNGDAVVPIAGEASQASAEA